MSKERITVCFAGSRPQRLPSDFIENNNGRCILKERIKAELTDLIENENAVCFISAMELGFDMLCAEAVLELKKLYPNITLECMLPYETQAKNWSEHIRDKYFYIIENCDIEILQQTRYTPGCVNRNYCRIIDISDFVLTIKGARKSGPGKVVEYANEVNKLIINIA